MRYEEDDKTYAVIKYADQHPVGKLKWCDIVQWVQLEATWKSYPRIKCLKGIVEYQFSRPIKKNGKTCNRECKLRFDEINAARKAVAEAKLPDLISARPEKFLMLSPTQQMNAITDVQTAYKALIKKMADADQRLRSIKVDTGYMEALTVKVDALAERYEKAQMLLNKLVKMANDAELIRIMEQYDIPMDTLDHVKIMDELDAGVHGIYSIKEELKNYRLQNKEEEDMPSEQKDFWDISVASIFK